jgi:phthiocerol/phenolphthiocerol synthesis type-I polyketide synthase E
MSGFAKDIHRNKEVLATMETSLDEGALAIIGLAGRFPGARTVDEFWWNIQHGREAITFLTDEQLRSAGVTEEEFQNPNYVRASSVLADIEYFDASFFG